MGAEKNTPKREECQIMSQGIQWREGSEDDAALLLYAPLDYRRYAGAVDLETGGNPSNYAQNSGKFAYERLRLLFAGRAGELLGR